METLRTGFTYLTGLIVLVGSGMLLLVVPGDRFEQILPFVTAIDGAVVAYIFAREQTQVVQSGNGLERTRLDAVDRKVEALLLSTPPPGSNHPAPVSAERVDVTGDEVTVSEGSPR